MSIHIIPEDTDVLFNTGVVLDARGALLTGATTKTVTVRNLAGADIGGGAITLTENPGSSGIYEAILPNGLPLTEGDEGRLDVVLDAGSEKHGEWEFIYLCQKAHD